jgi:hypothetical protein
MNKTKQLGYIKPKYIFNKKKGTYSKVSSTIIFAVANRPRTLSLLLPMIKPEQFII